jgi:polyvinyl alcohol dehydrogenase (cytochrome)
MSRLLAAAAAALVGLLALAAGGDLAAEAGAAEASPNRAPEAQAGAARRRARVSCARGNRVSLGLRVPRGQRLDRAALYVNGRPVRRFGRSALRVRRGGVRLGTRLRRVPRRTFRVTAVAVTTRGGRIRRSARFRRCARVIPTCVRGRTVSVTLRVRRRQRFRRAALYVNGRRVRRFRGSRLRVRRGRVRLAVRLRRVPRRTFRVTAVAVTRRGARIRRAVRYRRCTPGTRGPLVIPGCANDTVNPNNLHPGGEWRLYGRDLSNTRHQSRESVIGTGNAAQLGPIWTFSSKRAGGEGDFTGTPVVADGCVFAGSNRGYVFAMNAETGKPVWKAKVPNGGTINGTVAVPGDGKVYVGVSSPAPTSDAGTCEGATAKDRGCVGPYIVALSEVDGSVAWKTAGLEDAVGSDIYASPQVFDVSHNGRDDPVLFSGISGWGAESGGLVPGSSGEVRHRFDGSYVLLDARSGRLLRKTYTIRRDPNDGDAGCGIWSTPAVDTRTGDAYVGTSNPFKPQREHPHCNAVLRIGVDRSRGDFGRILGSYKATNEEYFSEFLPNYPCIGTGISPTPSQDLGTCPDMDLSVGASPNLFRDSGGRKLVGVGQKSGIYHTLEAGTMRAVWKQILGAPTLIGGIVGSTAYDGRSLFGPNTAPGFTWSVRKDDGRTRWIANHAPGYGNPVAVANGVVYQSDQSPVLNAYDADNGNQLLRHELPSETQGGVSIARNTVYASVGNTASAEGFIMALRPGGSAGTPGGGDSGNDDPGSGGGGDGGDSGGGGGSGSGPLTTSIVAAPQNNFITRVVPVSVSGRANFVNLDATAHDVASRAKGPDGRPLFRADVIGTGQTAPVQGTNRLRPGQSYDFLCTIHPGMTGQVVATP